MKLAELHTVSETFRKHLQRIRPLLTAMPQRKQEHSQRVGRTLHRAGLGQAGVSAGLLHDYLERGGDLTTLQAHLDELDLPEHTLHIITALTHDKEEPDELAGNQPLAQIRRILPKLDPGIRDLAILTKMADRLDNLQKRARRGGIGPNYRRKSLELMHYLSSHYNGPGPYFARLAAIISKVLKIRGLSAG